MSATAGSAPTGGRRRRTHFVEGRAKASVSSAAQDKAPVPVERGRTPLLEPREIDRLFRDGVSLFNGGRYWHAHEAWETLWRAASDNERDFYQGLIQIAAGLLHLQRRNARGARNKLAEGLARLDRYQPVHHGIDVNELVGVSERYLRDLNDGYVPYLIPPLIRFVDADSLPDWGA